MNLNKRTILEDFVVTKEMFSKLALSFHSSNYKNPINVRQFIKNDMLNLELENGVSFVLNFPIVLTKEIWFSNFGAKREEMIFNSLEQLLLLNRFLVFSDKNLVCEIDNTYIENLDAIINYSELVSTLDPEFVLKPDLEIKEEYSNEDLVYMEKDLFGIFAVCSNSNTRVFEEETVCIHNHNESLYTFVLNAVSTYQGEDYGDGKSYIYGPISIHEKEWLREEKIESKKNVCHVISLSSEKAEFVYGKFLFHENLSRFGRSDKYINNPRDITLSNL